MTKKRRSAPKTAAKKVTKPRRPAPMKAARRAGPETLAGAEFETADGGEAEEKRGFWAWLIDTLFSVPEPTFLKKP